MFKNLFDRIFRAIKIDVELYEEVERDKSATIRAGLVVVLSSVAAGVGALQLGASNFLLAPILSLLSWYVWAYVIYFVGVKLFKLIIQLSSGTLSDLCPEIFSARLLIHNEP